MLISMTDMRRLFGRLGLDPLEDPIFDGDRGLVEHLAHEVGHALSLRIPPSRDIANAVALTLGDLPRKRAVREEALVLASEMVALPRLGITFEEDEPGQTMRDAAEVQGVPDRIFWAEFGSQEARELGMRVLHFLLRQGGRGRRS